MFNDVNISGQVSSARRTGLRCRVALATFDSVSSFPCTLKASVVSSHVQMSRIYWPSDIEAKMRKISLLSSVANGAASRDLDISCWITYHSYDSFYVIAGEEHYFSQVARWVFI